MLFRSDHILLLRCRTISCSFAYRTISCSCVAGPYRALALPDHILLCVAGSYLALALPDHIVLLRRRTISCCCIAGPYRALALLDHIVLLRCGTISCSCVAGSYFKLLAMGHFFCHFGSLIHYNQCIEHWAKLFFIILYSFILFNYICPLVTLCSASCSSFARDKLPTKACCNMLHSNTRYCLRQTAN